MKTYLDEALSLQAGPALRLGYLVLISASVVGYFYFGGDPRALGIGTGVLVLAGLGECFGFMVVNA